SVKAKKEAAGFAVINNIEEECITSATLPRVYVIGDESAAKSTVLARLLLKRILPCGDGIITRQALVLQLRYNPSCVIAKMTLTLPGKLPIMSIVDDEIRLLLTANHNEIKKTGLGISNEEGTLFIESSTVPNIDL